MDSDDENWKMSGSRKLPANRNQPIDTRERIALDISLLKKQYAKLRERQRQANITNAAKQQPPNPTIGNTKPSNINQYLIGKNAIVSRGKRGGPPAGAIPPARVTLPMSISNKYQQKRTRNATIDNASTSIHRLRCVDNSNIPKKANTLPRRRSESSSYSEDSDKDVDSDDEYGNRVIALDTSSSSTSLCDDEVGNASSFEQSPMKSRIHSSASDDCSTAKDLIDGIDVIEDESLKSTYIRFNDDSDCDVVDSLRRKSLGRSNSEKNEPNIQIEMDSNVDIENNDISSNIKTEDKKSDLDLLKLPNRDRITSTSQLSPIADILHFLASSTISPLKTPTSYLLNSYPLCEVSEENQDEVDGDIEPDLFKVSDEGVTNAYFERVNHVPAEQQLELDFGKELPKNDDSEDMTLGTSSASNKNTDRILKMIEENSKILDRIMSKNAQVPDSQNQLEESDDVSENTQKCDSLQAPEAKIYKNEEIISDIRISDDNEKQQESSQGKSHGAYRKLSIPQVIETVHENPNLEVAEKGDPSSSADAKAGGDEIIFKYGDLSECISKYLDSPTERYERNENEKKLIQKSETEKSNEFILPTSLALLTHDDNSTEDMNNLLKQSFLEYSKSPSASLPIDSKLENDLETLLKMSAELLRDEFPISLANTEQCEAKEDNTIQMMSTENNSFDLMSTTISDLDSTEAMESKRNSSYYDVDTLQSEMESVAGDISSTISSIKNTIKSIDSLCQDDSRRSRDRTDKTLDDIIKVVERLEEEKEIRSKSQESRSSEHSRPPPITMSMYEHSSRDEIGNDSNLSNPRYSVGSRISRDRRRRKDDDFGEYESRARRTKSPPSLSMNRFSGDFSSEFSFDSKRPSLIGSEHNSGSVSGTISKTASPYKSIDKFEIRHTTVTSTFYDRFLSQKYEEKHKMDRSPSSPIINKAYLNSLKPTASLKQSYLTSDNDYKRKRASRSNETSPANLPSGATRSDALRFTSTAPKSSYLLLPQLSTSSSIHRSCDNILSNLSSTSGSAEFVQKYSYQPNKTYDLHMISNSNSSNIDTDEILRRHSSAAFNQSTSLTSALPIKPKKPSELGIKLGLYKP